MLCNPWAGVAAPARRLSLSPSAPTTNPVLPRQGKSVGPAFGEMLTCSTSYMGTKDLTVTQIKACGAFLGIDKQGLFMFVLLQP